MEDCVRTSTAASLFCFIKTVDHRFVRSVSKLKDWKKSMIKPLTAIAKTLVGTSCLATEDCCAYGQGRSWALRQDMKKGTALATSDARAELHVTLHLVTTFEADKWHRVSLDIANIS